MDARRTALLLAPALGALLLGACGGGGSATGGGGPPIVSPPPTPSPPPPPAPVPASPNTVAGWTSTEYQGTGADTRSSLPLDTIGAAHAYVAGAYGDGVVIATLDSGVDRSQPELAGRIHSASRDMDAARASFQDVNGHGTLIAGMIAANRDSAGMHGVAFRASVMALRTDTSAGVFSNDYIVQAIDYAVANGADIINMSLASPSPNFDIQAAFERAAAAGVILVTSAGNESLGNPTYPASFAGSPEMRGLMIATGASDGASGLAFFSNNAGPTRDYFVIAPGFNIATSRLGGGYDIVHGTSIAAPIVSGALALILSGFPSLTPQQAVDLLLRTATDLDVPGSDALSGRGLVNLQRAFAPVGSATIAFGPAGADPAALSPASTVPLEAVLAPASGAFGDWAAASGAFEGLMFRDDYGRPFAANLAPMRPSSMALDRFETLARGARLRGGWTRTPSDGVFLGAAFLRWSEDRPAPANFGMGNGPRDFEWGGEFRIGNATLGFASGSMAPGLDSSHGAAPIGMLSLSDELGASASLARSGQWAHGAYDLGAWRIAGRASLESGAFGAASLGRRFGAHLVAVEAGTVRETDAIAGGVLASRFGAEDGALSRFAALEWSGPLDAVLGPVLGSGWRGRARAEAVAPELRDSFALRVTEQPWASAWSVGAERAFSPDFALGFAVSQSLRAENGAVLLNIPVAGTETGSAIHDLRAAALTPSGREIGLETALRWRPADNLFVRAAARYATDPGHVANAPAELMGWADIALEF